MYPDECPVFWSKLIGRDVVLRPSMLEEFTADRAEVGDVVDTERMALVSDDSWLTWMDFDVDDFAPLTRAARELLAWVRQ